jgi:hypothetical protein
MHLKRSYWSGVDFTIDKLNLLVPITIIPAVGLLILSTSARFIHVNDVISKFTKEECNEHKIKVRRELKRANYLRNSLISSYVSIAIFLLGTILTYLSLIFTSNYSQTILIISLFIGVLFVFIAVFNLIVESALNFRLLESHTDQEKD